MPERSSKSEDPNQRTWQVVEEAIEDQDAQGKDQPETEPSEKNPAAVALGRLGGKKGGKARADSLSATERTEIARKAALARWKKKDDT